jgi:hypothetical protein
LNGETYHLSYAAGTGGNDLVLFPGAAPVGVPGDFNDDGFVDAGDYVTWRKGILPANDEPPAGAGTEDYDTWFEQFGSNGPGSGGSPDNGPVPEPSAVLLAVLALSGITVTARRRS